MNEEIKNAIPVTFEIGDLVCYGNSARTNKLDVNWMPYRCILEQTSPVTFYYQKKQQQLNGSTLKARAQHLKLANLNTWQIATDNAGRRLRPSNYVVPPDESDTDSDSPDFRMPAPVLSRCHLERSDSG